MRAVGIDALRCRRARPSPHAYPARPATDNIMLPVIFLVAVFAIIVTMQRGVIRGADVQLRARFDAEGPRGETSRRLMRESGYRV
ncbi:hypothetical protein [Burkholderia stabilis]|uniref:hypothetical protein n=1 Tax=Burkholderia stabilis TaxID=95485 RepID=UPI0012EAB20A|nr:hypothetical protein [Burkholderia stabilis]HDR9489780.1 hypothetical protein [Burkholderia stabilis]HDR9520874.1 hypothetical protein [Burkholderia stabilis]HDR9528625.1 hypothetical protein [Burkholderia stabilis]HDR9536622.1 hypothetical protein [Burkholderia stabilis]HDR9545889.1 hypothetical protein [Burkholderia stabilis]